MTTIYLAIALYFLYMVVGEHLPEWARKAANLGCICLVLTPIINWPVAIILTVVILVVFELMPTTYYN